MANEHLQNRIYRVRNELATARQAPDKILQDLRAELYSHLKLALEIAALLCEDERNANVIKRPGMVHGHIEKAIEEAGFEK
jgi:hypothetical protein